MPKQAAQPAATNTSETVESITESKLSRVEMIAREALDILGEEAPEDLRLTSAQERTKHEAALEKLEHRLIGAAEQIKDLTRQLKSAERLAEDRFTEAEEAWALASAHAADLSLTTSALATANDELDLARVTCDSRAREIGELQTHITSITRELDTLRVELTETSDDRETIRGQLTQAAARIESLETELSQAHISANKDSDRLNNELAAMREQFESHTEAAERLAADIAAAHDAVATLEETRDEQAQRIESLVHDLTHTRNQLAERGTKLNDAEFRLQAAREALAESETEAEEARESSSIAAEQVAAHAAEIGNVRREIADLTQRLADRDRRISDLLDQAGNADTTQPRIPGPAPMATPEVVTHEVDSPEAASPKQPATENDELDMLRSALDARETELSFVREQMDRADERAERYKERAETAERSLEKAAAIVRRARRRSAKRTEQFEGMVTAMRASRIRSENLEATQIALTARLKKTVIIAASAGGVALLCLLAAILT